MTGLSPLLATAFAAGLLGSAHCLGMCAGISGLFAAGGGVASATTQFIRAIAYNAGRVLSYALLGTAVAAVGSTVVDALPTLATPVRLASGALIILIGLQVAFNWHFLSSIERAGGVVWKRLAPLAAGMIPATSNAKALSLGLIWGWLPCGLVYSVLLVAATTDTPLHGGLVMIAFGLGTMPAMVSSGLSAARLAAFMSRNRLGAGLLIVLLGIATLAVPLISLSGNPEGHPGHFQRANAVATGPALFQRKSYTQLC